MIKTILFPLIWLYRQIFLTSYRFTSSSGISLIILSFFGMGLSWMLAQLFAKYTLRETEIQEILSPQLLKIKKESKGEELHKRTAALYRRYSYNPLLSLRSAIPVFIQLPFLFAAYQMISGLSILEGQSLWIVKDLAKPDGLLFSVNILPFIMTIFNLLAAFIAVDFKRKDRIQAIIIAALFLILLYGAPSALLIYWTMNNLIYLIKALVENKRKTRTDRKESEIIDIISFKKYFEHTVSFLGQYFVLLSLFYLYQAVAIEGGFVFESYLKYVPLFIASIGLFIIQIIRLKYDFEPTLRHVLAASATGATLTIITLGIIFITVGRYVGSGFNIATKVNIASYMIMLVAFIIGFFLPKIKDHDEHILPIGRLLAIIILSLIPAVHYAKINSDYLIGSFKYIFFVAIPLVALINYFISWQIAGHREKRSQIAIKSGVFSLLLIALPIIRFSLKLTSKVDIDFWFLLFTSLLLTYFINTKKRAERFIQIVGIILLVFIISGFFGEKTPPGALYPRKKLTPEMSSIKFKEKPNIYLFVYDGIPNERVFMDQNLPFNKLNSLLDDYGFMLYQDTYTLGEASVSSMSKMLDFTDSIIKVPEGRDIYAGNSWTNLILRNNGYKSRFLLSSHCVGYNAVTHTDLFDEMYPIRTVSSAKIDFFAVLMRGILQGEMRFDTRGLLDVDETGIQKRKHEVIQEDKSSSFIVNHYEWPGHSQNSGKCLPNETELWIGRYNVALELIEQDFDLIEKYDPNAIVIAIGDHGPSLLGDCYNLAAWKKEDITPELMWDRIGTLLAIRWPDKRKAAKFDEAIVTNQDVFPVVFSYLADDPEYLKYCPDKVFWGYATPTRSEIGFDRGKIILEK